MTKIDVARPARLQAPGEELLLLGEVRTAFTQSRQFALERLPARGIEVLEAVQNVSGERQGGGEQRGLDPLPFAAAIAFAQRHQDAECRQKARSHVGIGGPDQARRTALVCGGDGTDSGHALDHDVVASVVRERTPGTVGRILEVDEFGPQRVKARVIETETSEIRSFQRHEHDVGRAHQRVDDFAGL